MGGRRHAWMFKPSWTYVWPGTSARRRQGFRRTRRTGKGADGFSRQHHRLHVATMTIGEPKGRDAIGQQDDEIASIRPYRGSRRHSRWPAVWHGPK